MAPNSNSHITVSYSDIYGSTTVTFKVTDKVLRKLQKKRDWLGRAKPELTGEALADWLRRHGCRLDSDGGPALVGHYNTGWSFEEYYRDGVEHRVDGPATVIRRKDGSAAEFHYVHGKQCGAFERNARGDASPLRPPLRMPPFPRP